MTFTAWMLNALTGAPSYTGKMVRQTLSPLLGTATSARPLGAVSGVRPGTPATTVTATSTTWTCQPHGGVLDVQTSGVAGPYPYALDAAATGAVTAADATYARVDIVYAQISDTAEDGSGVESGKVDYLAGTPALTPVAPATPARSMVIAQINVPKSGTGSPTVTWVAPVCAAAGGIFIGPPAAQITALDAIATATEPIYIDDGTGLKRSVGSGFTLVARPPSGTYTPTLTNATVGNGTLESSWSQVASLVTVQGSLTLGSTSSIAAAAGNATVGIGLPVAAAAFYGTAGTNLAVGTATFLSTGVQIYLGFAVSEGSTTLVSVYTTTGSPLARAAVNGTSPYTWKTGDVLSWVFRYVAA